MVRWRWSAAVALVALALSPPAISSATTPQPEAPSDAGSPGKFRGDATSDPLLLLLRAPEVRRELAIRNEQEASLDQLLDAVDGPLWRLRDAQFQNAETARKAWRLIDEVESQLGKRLQREQHARLRQLVVQARGPRGLLFADVIQRLNLSPEQADRIGKTLETARNEAHRIRNDSSLKDDAEKAKRLEALSAAQGKKLLSLLSDEQSRRWQQLAGKPYDFRRLTRRYARAPQLRGIEEWINSAPLTLADLRGKVVVLHFFTYSCINCVHNQPAYKAWHERFSQRQVLVLGIHTPEGEGDKRLEGIRKALGEQKIAYPVAVDNQKETWTAWANHTWPAVYLIDRQGYVRYWWYGELNWRGAQGEKLYTEKIAELLAEDVEPPGTAHRSERKETGPSAPPSSVDAQEPNGRQVSPPPAARE